MKKITLYFTVALWIFLSQNILGQELQGQEIEYLEAQKDRILQEEKEALKAEVKDINQRLDSGALTFEEAKLLKEEVAKKRALNIEQRISIIENKISLLQRNNGNLVENDSLYQDLVKTMELEDENFVFGIRLPKKQKPIGYDKRTSSDVVLAFGFNNALIYGESFADSPYKYLGSRFFEIGYAWNTRVFKNSNWLRFKYGLSFQFNGLKPTGNRIFAQDDFNGFPTVTLAAIPDENGQPQELTKSKFRMDSFIVPIHFEFGPSAKREYGDYVRYSTYKKFRAGIGGYVGFNYNNIQKTRGQRYFDINSPIPIDVDFQRTIYGLSTYLGFDDASLYFKYELTQIFKGPSAKQNNISLGIRFDL